jgi:hypothetical protein
MRRREQCRKVLNSQVQRWSAMTCEQLISELHDLQAYEAPGQGGRTKSSISPGLLTAWTLRSQRKYLFSGILWKEEVPRF